MRRGLRQFVAEPVLAFSRASRLRGCIVSLMYHEVLPDSASWDAWTVVRESAFRAQMLYMKKNFEIVSIDQALQRMADGGKGLQSAAAITFDDGYLGNRKIVWPIVEELRLPITIFVATEAVQTQLPHWYDRVIGALLGDAAIEIDLRHRGLRTYRIPGVSRGEDRWTRIQRLLSDVKCLKPDDRERAVEDVLKQSRGDSAPRIPLNILSAGDIQAMARSEYITFGAHSHGHENLTQLAPDEVRTSALRAKLLLEEWSGRAVRHFAYPFGAFNAEVARVVQDCGFASGQATKPGFWRPDGSAYAIPRIGIGRFDSLGWFKARVSGISL